MAETAEADLEYFERSVRPLLHKHCYECHSAESKTLQGGLMLDSREALLRGGDSGPALVAGKPDESLLVTVLHYNNDDIQMPPRGKLSTSEIAAITEWVRRGAPLPDHGASDTAPRAVDIEAGRRFWSFQPLGHYEPPQDDTGWSANRVDRFVLAAMREQGLSPSPEADRRTLIRRLAFDLTGLPPTPEEVREFVADDSPQALERLVQRLLDSPAYGERWGRQWLDLARYTDATASWLNGTGQAHLYRDWVVQALNDDLPYDEFVRRQLATDCLEHTGPGDLPALGFLGLSPTYWKELKLPAEIIKVIVADEWEERVDVVSRTFLGLTVACARCHDHKFDPITTRDYYALAGVFASTRMSEKPLIPASAYEPARLARVEVERLAAQLATLKKQAPKATPPAKLDPAMPLPPLEEDPARALAAQQAVHAERVAGLEAKIAELKKTEHYDAPLAHVVMDESLYVVRAGETMDSGTKLEYRSGARDLPLFIRGNPNRTGEVIPRRYLEVLSAPEAEGFRHGSGRLELAEAITRQSAPLAARVIVNRIWLGHFGRGLVETPSNFGQLGARPSHPQLLDDLAERLIANGWSLKWLHRELVLSSTYRQSSAGRAEGLKTDPDNRWLWRMNRRRLDFESWRDSMLQASGELDRALGGAATKVDDPANVRRTLYSAVHRREMPQMLQIHDFPAPIAHSPMRVATTTPLQGLYVLNSEFVGQRARKLPLRVLAEQPGEQPAEELPAAIDRLYHVLYQRGATAAEQQLARDYLGADASDPQSKAWRQYAQALLGSNEFLFVD
ncbi:MAG: PSD1 domain-containing protein [Planctomycetales bacterium]|nr:PSD1 domain-containing protein [Planctomycetales bacterium]